MRFLTYMTQVQNCIGLGDAPYPVLFEEKPTDCYLCMPFKPVRLCGQPEPLIHRRMISSPSAPTYWVNTRCSSLRPHAGSAFLKTKSRGLLQWDTGAGSRSVLDVFPDWKKREEWYVLSWFLQAITEVPDPTLIMLTRYSAS